MTLIDLGRHDGVLMEIGGAEVVHNPKKVYDTAFANSLLSPGEYAKQVLHKEDALSGELVDTTEQAHVPALREVGNLAAKAS